MNGISKSSAETPRVEIGDRDERAALWAIRVNAGSISNKDEAELEAWTSEDVRNLGAFVRAMAANAYCDRAVALGVPYPPASGSASDGAGEIATCEDSVHPPLKGGLSRRAWIGGGLGAAAAAVVAAVSARHWWGIQSIVAPKGNVQRTALRDGSAVTLNSSAEIEIAFQDAVRKVSLLAGEANFDVAKDAARPFIVDTGPVQIRVVGTSFNVRKTEADAVSVTVREGIVEIFHGAVQPVRLIAGDQLSFANRRMTQARLTMAEVDRIGLWQRGELDLTGMTLGDAAREFARYSDTQIVIDQPSVANLKVAGIYSTSDPAGFAQAAALAQGLDFAVAGDRVTLSQQR